MTAYYNEIDEYAAQWLRNLIAAGHIAPGDVDTRSITEVHHDDLKNYTQCHFFAGIGVWSYALRLAGWDDSRPVWTGSCPCQPFSVAGKGEGFSDDRHLWPVFADLIRQRKPPIVFGEQVASKDADVWIDAVQDDLETMGYAVGAVAFPSAGVGAPHIRDRMYWVADSDMSDAKRQRQERLSLESKQKADRRGIVDCWQTDAFIRCADGRTRPIKSSVQPLVNGNSCRLGRLRAYGNAINAQAAKAFIEVVMGYRP